MALSLTSCATSGDNWDQEKIGNSLIGGTITYTYNKISPNKYTLNALGYRGFDNSPSAEQVVEGFKARANKLCLPKSANYEYHIGTWTYPTETSTISFPTSAPRVQGIVSCN